MSLYGSVEARIKKGSVSLPANTPIPKRVVSNEAIVKAQVTRFMKNQRQIVDGTWVHRRLNKQQLAAVREVAVKFYPEWVKDPWVRFLFPRKEQKPFKVGSRIPLAEALDWPVDYDTMSVWKSNAQSPRSREAHPDLQFFVNKSARKMITRTFAECLLCYAHRRWGAERGDERAQSAIEAILKHAHRDARKSEHRTQTDRRKKVGRKFSTRSRTAYWDWILGFLHSTDKFKHPEEKYRKAVAVELKDELDHNTDGGRRTTKKKPEDDSGRSGTLED